MTHISRQLINASDKNLKSLEDEMSGKFKKTR